MTNNKFYHTSVNIKDYPFEKIYINNISKELINNIKLFNTSNDIEYKKEISKNIPVKFPICRYCGDTIINSNFKILLKRKEGYIQISNPSVYCREIDNKKYYLSCCKKCLLTYFKDNPPKSEKYYFMKANIYGQYCFGYSNEEYKKICSMTVGVTYKSMINKWGDIEGKKRWKIYCDKHSKIANKQTFINKYGLEEGLRIYHDSRAITKDLCIKRYGEEEGLKKWNIYKEKQRYTCSLEYFIKKYGKENGEKKYKEFSIKRALSGQSCLKNTVSKISQDLFNNLYKYICTNEIYYNDLNYEYILHDDITHKNYFLDFYDKTKNLVIEFQGDYWHANPNKYKETDILNFYSTIYANKKIVSVKDIWESDKKKKKFVCEYLNNPIYLQIWESDYKENKNKIINDILLYYNINLNNYELPN